FSECQAVSGDSEADGRHQTVIVVVPENVGGRKDDDGEDGSEELAAAAQRVADQRSEEHQTYQEAKGLQWKGCEIGHADTPGVARVRLCWSLTDRMRVGDLVDGMGAIAAAIVDGTHASGESPSND